MGCSRKSYGGGEERGVDVFEGLFETFDVLVDLLGRSPDLTRAIWEGLEESWIVTRASVGPRILGEVDILDADCGRRCFLSAASSGVTCTGAFGRVAHEDTAGGISMGMLRR